MNDKLFSLRILLLLFLLGVSACSLFEDNGEKPEEKNKYFLSSENLAASTIQIIKPVFQALEKQYDELSGISDKMKYGVWVNKIIYKTTYKGKEVLASGVVCFPMTASGSFPMLSFQNGTNTLHAKAPSENYNDYLFQLIEAVASAGFVVVMPDYLGFGSSSTMYHPYLHKESTVGSVTDLFRAVREMVEESYSFTLTKETYLMGYSQGGWATMALKKHIEQNLSSEFELKATSCGAGPYNLAEVAGVILSAKTYEMPYFLAYIMNSYIQSGEITLTYADIFNPPYSGNDYISNLFNGKNDPDYINSKLSTNISTLFVKDFVDNVATGSKYASVRKALSDNSVEAWKTNTPMVIVYGTKDTFVTPTVSSRIYSEFLAAGTDPGLISLVTIEGMGHQEAVIPWGVTTINFFFQKRGN
ncbi:MAG: alpha/beta fold hydrolase [Prolixibacteraceae bacterium]|jgi:pimeloyl-ACP methyl ester carboxylesterase|nr:alpha/beta fold hydrolase [Prolixibacteraceae bacterium]MDI9565144.1 alpha/beta fold hydrolase [Bacteroidota bacterium]OQB81310.1 MAG: Alpha/beta hydrolase family protein [Bacteroidetes bacterium ADurb.Bin123]HOF56373.1 alpha/beta fold hydrolase [Prolixibacteraceae bacterium]HOS00884.1 alpha/beta fold hydrolase [Prolixibacteraceae bacterium]